MKDHKLRVTAPDSWVPLITVAVGVQPDKSDEDAVHLGTAIELEDAGAEAIQEALGRPIGPSEAMAAWANLLATTAAAMEKMAGARSGEDLDPRVYIVPFPGTSPPGGQAS